MYAVIKTGGKQERVAKGQQLRVELLGQAPGAEVAFTPVLLVDGDTVLATPEALAGSSGRKSAASHTRTSRTSRSVGAIASATRRSRSPRSRRRADRQLQKEPVT